MIALQATGLLVVGTGGFAREAATVAHESGRFSTVGLLAEDRAAAGTCVGPFAVVGTDADLPALRQSGYSHVFVAIGTPPVRATLSTRCCEAGYRLATLIHATAYVSGDVPVGEGTVVYPHATIMTGCAIGRGCLVNTNASIGHETTLGDFVNLNPGAAVAGRVRIGSQAYIGIGAVILENLSIGEGAVIGAGAVVTRDVPPDVTVIGIPARVRA